MSFYANKVNGSSIPGEKVTSQFDYLTITTTVDIRVASEGSAASQGTLDKLVEVVSTVAQPVILGKPVVDGSNYVLKLAVEHTGAWSATALVAAIVADQYNGAGFTTLNTTVVVASTL